MSMTNSIPPRATEDTKQDDKTECETPISSPDSSPERECFVARKMKREVDAEVKVEAEAETDESEASCSKETPVVKSEDAVEDDQDYSDWKLSCIKDPAVNDVLYGRGGGTNHHDGNKRYRTMVEKRKVDYVNSKRLDKPLVALDIIREWRNQKPPGRFLKLDEKTDLWFDVGDKKAREKTSQALREKAPLLRKQQEEQIQEMNDSDLAVESDDQTTETKNTRFNLPPQTARPSKTIGRAMLAREHSLGRDYVPEGEPISIKGFSWDSTDAEPCIPEDDEPEPVHFQGPPPSHQLPPPHQYYGSYGHPHPPLPTAPTTSCISVHDRQQSLAGNPLSGASTAESAPTRSFEECYPTTPGVGPWHPHPAAHPALAPHSDEQVQAEWTKRRYRDDHGGEAYRQTRSAEHEYRSSEFRNHGHWRAGSDCSPGPGPGPGYNPRFADAAASEKGYMHRWEGYSNGYHYSDSRGPPPPMYDQGHPEWSSPHRYAQPPYPYSAPSGSPHSQFNNPSGSPDAPYQIQQHSTSYSTDHHTSNYSGEHRGPYDSKMDAPNGRGHPLQGSPLKRSGLDVKPNDASPEETSCSPSRSIPRPHPIKRDTSNHNENSETKSQVKKCNRQRSIGNRRQTSMSSLEEVSESTMNNLGMHMRQSSIGMIPNETTAAPLRKPAALGPKDRLCTIDQFDVGIEGHSSPLDHGHDHSEKPKVINNKNRGTSLESLKLEEVLGIINKPATICESNRIGTLGTLGSVDCDL
jgi:hypothetical protein